MLEFSVYLLYRAAFAIVRNLPLRVLVVLGNALGFCGWMIAGKYRRLALRNVGIAFGDEKSSAERRRLVRRHFQRLVTNLLAGLKLAAIPLEKTRAHVQIENADAAHRELRAGRPVIFVLSHLGNWELQAQLFPSLIGYVRNGTVFQPLRNRYIDQHFRKLRARAGLELFNRAEGFHKAIELLRGGGAIGILSDQHAGDHGIWVPFFGKLASTTSLPALLAKRTGAALIGTAVYTDDAARWRIVLTEKIDGSSDSVELLTAKMNELIAQQIRRAPEDWFWVHNRWKTPQPNFLLARYKRGLFVPENTQRLQPFRILIRSSNWLGDAIMSIPAVRAIKRGRPDAHLTVAAPEKIAPVWKLVPEIDEIVPLPTKSLLKTVRRLNAQPRFDVGIAFPNSLRSAFELLLARVPRRVGYRGHWRAALLNQIVRESKKPRPPVHHAERYLRIAADCGAETANIELPALSHGSNSAGPARTKPQSLPLGLCPGAEYGPAKRWLPDRFAEVAQKISIEHNIKWTLFGTRKDVNVGQHIASVLGDRCINRIGETNLDQLIEELQRCRLLLTNDTGTMHLAALLDVPVVAVFGSTEPVLTRPLGNGHIVLRHHVECSPCFLRECPIDFRCMHAVATEEVTAAVLAILERNQGA
jgi:lipopolysaccharide heptosyltransferase II